MKLIIRIARTELATLFYSPIAWLILIIFACQVGFYFLDPLSYFVGAKLHGRSIDFSITQGVLVGINGLYEKIQGVLYLYIPLLTMGIMSREYSNGSIKLLYSSPVTASQIVLGKYFAMVVCAMLFAVLLLLPVAALWSTMGVVNVETGLALSGLLGLFLLICAYMAIGLFMSSLSSYQVVAAIATLFTLAALNFVGGVGQGIDLVRDLTHWLSMGGRASNMVAGLITSDDIAYFLLVAAMFVTFAVFRIQDQKTVRSLTAKTARYAAVVAIVVAVGYMTSRPTMLLWADATANKRMTLSPASQEIFDRMEEPLTITSYNNILSGDFGSGTRRGDEELFAQYVRQRPRTQLRQVFYYAPPVGDSSILKRYPDLTPEETAHKMAVALKFDPERLITREQVDAVADVRAEGYNFVRQIEDGVGNKTFLRIFTDMIQQPTEVEITTALSRLSDGPVRIGFLAGHGERSPLLPGDGNYRNFAASPNRRNALINRGFDIVTLDTIADGISPEIDIVVIADPLTPLSEAEMVALDDYLARGGDMLVLAESQRREMTAPLLSRLGLELMDGLLVQPAELWTPTLIPAQGTEQSAELADAAGDFWGRMPRRLVSMPGVGVLRVLPGGADFEIMPLLESDPDSSWLDHNAGNYDMQAPVLDSLAGERRGAYTTAAAVRRGDQRIMVFADADWLSNAELSQAGREGMQTVNYTLTAEVFRWLAHGKYPLTITYPPQKGCDIDLSANGLMWVKILYVWILPALIAVVAAFILLLRRRG